MGMTRGRAGRRPWGGWLVTGLLLAGCGQQTSPTASSDGAVAEKRLGEKASAGESADVVDALFLGSGPLIPRDGVTACFLPAVWSGFPRGTTVRVRVSTTVSSAVQEVIRSAAAQVGPATNGGLHVLVEPTDDLRPRPAGRDVTVTAVASPRAEGCPTSVGCVLPEFLGRGILLGVRVVEPASPAANAAVRDVVGHGVLGLCRIDAKRIGGAANSLMSAGPGVRPGDNAGGLTSLDEAAVRAVYTSTLNPGAARADFLRAGLVNLQLGEAPRAR